MLRKPTMKEIENRMSKEERAEKVKAIMEEKANLYKDASASAYFAFRARHKVGWSKYLDDLMNGRHADAKRRCLDWVVFQLEELEKELAEVRKELAELQKTRTYAKQQADRLTITKEQRQAWNKAWNETQPKHERLINKASQLTADIKALEEKLDENMTDYEDIVQDAQLMRYELLNGYQPTLNLEPLIASYCEEHGEEPNADQLEEMRLAEIFHRCTSASGGGISKLAHADAMNGTKTKVEKVDSAFVESWKAIHGAENVGDKYKVYVPIRNASNSAVWDTLEQRNTKQYKGWFKVRHYQTIGAYQHIEQDTKNANGETVRTQVELARVYNPMASNQTDIELIITLYELLNLTDRERAFLDAFARRCRVEQDFDKCKEYAFTDKRVGVYSKDNQRQFFKRLKDHIKKQIESPSALLKMLEDYEDENQPKANVQKSLADLRKYVAMHPAPAKAKAPAPNTEPLQKGASWNEPKRKQTFIDKAMTEPTKRHKNIVCWRTKAEMEERQQKQIHVVGWSIEEPAENGTLNTILYAKAQIERQRMERQFNNAWLKDEPAPRLKEKKSWKPSQLADKEFWFENCTPAPATEPAPAVAGEPKKASAEQLEKMRQQQAIMYRLNQHQKTVATMSQRNFDQDKFIDQLEDERAKAQAMDELKETE